MKTALAILMFLPCSMILQAAELPLNLTAADNGKTIKLKVGQEAVVALKGNLTTGYWWLLKEIEGAAVVMDGKEICRENPHPDGMTAVPDTFSAVFTAVQEGQAKVKLEYRRPKKKNKPSAQTFEVTLVVKKQAGGNTILSACGIWGVIFPVEKTDFIASLTGRKDLQYWTPSSNDITNAMPRIRAFLAKQSPSIASRLEKYRCQYFGIVVRGKKRIYCNFLHSEGLCEHWQAEPLFTHGGGDYHFRLEYEAETEQCFNFEINDEI